MTPQGFAKFGEVSGLARQSIVAGLHWRRCFWVPGFTAWWRPAAPPRTRRSSNRRLFPMRSQAHKPHFQSDGTVAPGIGSWSGHSADASARHNRRPTTSRRRPTGSSLPLRRRSRDPPARTTVTAARASLTRAGRRCESLHHLQPPSTSTLSRFPSPLRTRRTSSSPALPGATSASMKTIVRQHHG